MRYDIPINNADDYDLQSLRQELETSGIAVKELFSGNGFLVVDVIKRLSKTDIIKAKTVIKNHTPLIYTWAGRNSVKHKVRTSEDVDRITAMRIRQLMAEDESQPFEAQLKLLTKLIEGLYTDISKATSLSNLKNRTAVRTAPYVNLLVRRRAILKEGKDFKVAHNL